MKTKTSKLGGLLSAVGVVGAGIYSIKSNKPLLTIILISAAGGLGGYLIGNAITKYYETN